MVVITMMRVLHSFKAECLEAANMIHAVEDKMILRQDGGPQAFPSLRIVDECGDKIDVVFFRIGNRRIIEVHFAIAASHHSGAKICALHGDDRRAHEGRFEEGDAASIVNGIEKQIHAVAKSLILVALHDG